METAQPTPARIPARRHLLRGCAHLAVAVAGLAAGGAVLGLGASRIQTAELEAGLRQAPPDLDRSDALSQNVAVFALGGLRSLAAEILSLDATSAWLANDWPRAERRWASVTMLAPQRVNYWSSASRDMAFNAESAVRHDDRMERVERARLSRYYFDRGVRFLEDAIANNPDSALLYCRLGDLLSDQYRRPRYQEAADAYHKAVELGASRLYERMEFYNLSRVRGKEREAYALGRKLFQNEANHVPSVLNLLFVLQNKLDLPQAERLSVEDIYGSEEEARKYLEHFYNNTLNFPTDGISAFLRRQRASE